MFENRVLRGIFGSKMEVVTGEWRKLHNGQLRDLYCTLDIIRVNKSRIMRWVGRVARMRENRKYIHNFGEETWGKDTTRNTQA